MDPLIAETAAAASQVGFPVIAFILMYRMADSTIKENTKALTDIRLTLEKVCEKIT
jgi:hypothetical protein